MFTNFIFQELDCYGLQLFWRHFGSWPAILESIIQIMQIQKQWLKNEWIESVYENFAI